jgi:hypothetical protein
MEMRLRKIKSSYKAKKALNRMKREPTEQEKIYSS